MKKKDFEKFIINQVDNKLYVDVAIRIIDEHKHKNKVSIFCSGIQYILKQDGYKITKVLNGRNLYNTSNDLRQHLYVFEIEVPENKEEKKEVKKEVIFDIGEKIVTVTKKQKSTRRKKKVGGKK
jgi:hypothetical protein